MNCFGFGDDNCYLWILILILLFCCKGCNIVDNVCGLLSNCGCILPIALALLCCCGKDKDVRYGCK